jgi:hypothetical protein
MNARTVGALVGIVILAVLAKVVTWPENGPAVGDSQAYAQQLAEAEGAQQDLIDAQRLSGAFRAAAKILRPSVVQINAMVKQRPMRRMQDFHQFRSPFGNDLFDELFRELEGRQENSSLTRRKRSLMIHLAPMFRQGWARESSFQRTVMFLQTTTWSNRLTNCKSS